MPARNYYLPERRLVDQQDASLVATPRVPRSKFIGSWTRKTTLDAGYLYPIMIQEVLPSDHLRYDVTAYIRMATPLFPIFDNQRVDTHFFFVPMRLLWENWEKMLGFQYDTTDDPTDHTIPTVPIDDTIALSGSIWDHFGLPIEGTLVTGQTLDINALPLRAYNLIYNEWFRDQNLTNSVSQNIGDGPDDPTDYALLRRGKFHDYFTSALPWPQKFTSPNIPLLGTAPIQGIGWQSAGVGTDGQTWLETDGTRAYTKAQELNDAGTIPVTLRLGIEQDATTGAPKIFADLTQASGVTIADFRQAMLIQELLERDARGGTRYVELIKNHFGVISPDARLQRPEYIGGGQTRLQITPIAQTAPTDDAPLGALGAAGTAAGQHSASYAATEHGYIIGLLSVRTELSYQKGLHRLWSRSTRYDFYWPTLAGLSEQAILKKEIYCTGNPALDDQIWGYQERWQEYRTQLSEVTGLFRGDVTPNLEQWHLSQDFDSPGPSLNTGFINDDPPMDRVLAAGDEAVNQQYLADILFRRTAVRPLPTFGIPASLTRF